MKNRNKTNNNINKTSDTKKSFSKHSWKRDQFEIQNADRDLITCYRLTSCDRDQVKLLSLLKKFSREMVGGGILENPIVPFMDSWDKEGDCNFIVGRIGLTFFIVGTIPHFDKQLDEDSLMVVLQKYSGQCELEPLATN